VAAGGIGADCVINDIARVHSGDPVADTGNTRHTVITRDRLTGDMFGAGTLPAAILRGGTVIELMQ
jgi:hypothetical protein